MLPLPQCECVSSGETKARMTRKNWMGWHGAGVGTALAPDLLRGGQLSVPPSECQREGTISALRLMVYLRAAGIGWA